MVNIIHKFSEINISMNYKLLEYDRIDISNEIGVNIENASKECYLSLLVFLK